MRLRKDWQERTLSRAFRLALLTLDFGLLLIILVFSFHFFKKVIHVLGRKNLYSSCYLSPPHSLLTQLLVSGNRCPVGALLEVGTELDGLGWLIPIPAGGRHRTLLAIRVVLRRGKEDSGAENAVEEGSAKPGGAGRSDPGLQTGLTRPGAGFPASGNKLHLATYSPQSLGLKAIRKVSTKISILFYVLNYSGDDD